MKLCVVGAGYVGFSLSVLLSEKNEIVIYDIDKGKINMINNNISPIDDEDIYYYNYDRIKDKLKGLSPVNYRLQSFN